MNRKKNENIFLWKKGNFSFIIIKKKRFFFFKEQTFIIYRYFFFEKKEKVFTLNSNIYYLIYNFF